MCCCLAIPGHGTKSWAPSQHECLRSREGCPVPSRPRRPSEAEERHEEGKTGSWAALQTEPFWQVPLVRSNAESPVVKPALGASGSSAASCPECCSGSSSGALLASLLSSAGPCKEMVKTQPPATSNINMWPCPTGARDLSIITALCQAPVLPLTPEGTGCRILNLNSTGIGC